MYILIKTSQEQIKACGSLYEAARGQWYLDSDRAEQCSHAIIAIRGERDIKAVYKINEWKNIFYNRYAFTGSKDNVLENKLLGRTINHKYFAKGRRNPIAYVPESDLLEQVV